MTAGPLPHQQTADALTEILGENFVAMVQTDTRDLTARGLPVFLTCGLDDTPQTVRGLAAQLDIPACPRRCGA